MKLSNATGYNYIVPHRIVVFRATDVSEKTLKALKAPDKRDKTIKCSMQIHIDKI